MSNATIFSYDQYDHINRITDAKGNTYIVTADIHGRPLTMEDRWATNGP